MKKKYERATMQVVELQQECHILAGSGQNQVSATRTSYGTASTDEGTEQTWE